MASLGSTPSASIGFVPHGLHHFSKFFVSGGTLVDTFVLRPKPGSQPKGRFRFATIRRPFRALGASLIGLIALSLVACTGGGDAATPASSTSSSSSGRSDLTVVEVNQTWPTLDPPVDPVGALDVNYDDAIYGQLFKQLPDGSIKPDLASGYSYSSDYLTLTVTLRSGVKFQDGTPFNADAVVWNLKRDFDPATACACLGSFSSVKSVDADGSDKVVLHLASPNAPLLQSFIAQAPNWIISPTAFQKEGAQGFGQKPVGAGPFKVDSNVASSTLTLSRNDDYYQPVKLKKLTFITTPNDQAAYAALQSGLADLVLGITTQSIINEAKTAGFQVPVTPGTQAQDLVFNTQKAPFDNQTAREAVAYAVNAKQLIDVVSPGFGQVMQGPGGPGSLYYEPKVPGFRGYDLSKAKQLVAQLPAADRHITLSHSNNTAVFAALGPAVGNQLTAAGFTVSYVITSPTGAAQMYSSGDYQINPSNLGAIDPDIGANGLPSRLSSGGLYSGTRDPALDQMINKSLTTVDSKARGEVFKQINKYISDKQYVVPLFSLPTALEASKGLTGIEATSNGNAATMMLQWAGVGWN